MYPFVDKQHTNDYCLSQMVIAIAHVVPHVHVHTHVSILSIGTIMIYTPPRIKHETCRHPYTHVYGQEQKMIYDPLNYTRPRSCASHTQAQLPTPQALTQETLEHEPVHHICNPIDLSLIHI